MLRSFTRLKRSAPAALEYPQLALYRSILRAHQRYLPPSARELGDAYVKSEFELHRGASAGFMAQFEREWRDYLTTLAVADKDGASGREMTADEVAALSDEQKVRAWLAGRMFESGRCGAVARVTGRIDSRLNSQVQLLKIRESAAGAPSVDTS